MATRHPFKSATLARIYTKGAPSVLPMAPAKPQWCAGCFTRAARGGGAFFVVCLALGGLMTGGFNSVEAPTNLHSTKATRALHGRGRGCF